VSSGQRDSTTPCPMDSSWRKWSLGQNFEVPSDLRGLLRSAHRLRPDKYIESVAATWAVAPDDASITPPSGPPPSFQPGSPRHQHAEWLFQGVTGGAPTTVTTRQLAERVIEIYWPQTRPHGARTLRQSGGGRDTQGRTRERHRERSRSVGPDGDLSTELARKAAPGRWERLVRKVEWKLIDLLDAASMKLVRALHGGLHDALGSLWHPGCTCSDDNCLGRRALRSAEVRWHLQRGGKDSRSMQGDGEPTGSSHARPPGANRPAGTCRTGR
jgi:hypothetical protein